MNDHNYHILKQYFQADGQIIHLTTKRKIFVYAHQPPILLTISIQMIIMHNQFDLVFNFDCSDLNLLLKCFKQGKIPNDVCVSLKKLESLLYCHDYFNPQSNENSIAKRQSIFETPFCIDKTQFLNYFCNHVPAFDNAQRDEFLSNCKHPLMRNVLTTLNNEYENISKKSRQDIFAHLNEDGLSLQNSLIMNENSADFISSLLKTIELDPIAATTLFESRFKIKISCSRIKSLKDFKNMDITHNKEFLSNLSRHCSIKIEIIDFENTYPKVKENSNKENTENKENKENQDDKESYNLDTGRSVLYDLWRLCEYGRHFNASTFEQIDRMIDVVLDQATLFSNIITRDKTCKCCTNVFDFGYFKMYNFMFINQRIDDK